MLTPTVIGGLVGGSAKEVKERIDEVQAYVENRDEVAAQVLEDFRAANGFGEEG